MKASHVVACCYLAIAAVINPNGHAESLSENYPYCGMNASGAMVCDFDSLEQCRSIDNVSCIENPGYIPSAPSHSPQLPGRR